MNFSTRFKLSLLFFLEFFIWGGWFVTMGTFLSQIFNSSGGELAMAYETQSIGAIIAPFIIGLIADRYFAAQKILGLLHLLGALGLAYNSQRYYTQQRIQNNRIHLFFLEDLQLNVQFY